MTTDINKIIITNEIVWIMQLLCFTCYLFIIRMYWNSTCDIYWCSICHICWYSICHTCWYNLCCIYNFTTHNFWIINNMFQIPTILLNDMIPAIIFFACTILLNTRIVMYHYSSFDWNYLFYYWICICNHTEHVLSMS